MNAPLVSVRLQLGRRPIPLALPGCIFCGDRATSARPFKSSPYMFKNLTAFHIGGTFDICLDAMDAALAKARFNPCGPTDEKSVGFVEPRGQNHGALIESAGCPMSRILRA